MNILEYAKFTKLVKAGGEGGGNEPTEEELTFTGNLDNAFRSSAWNWFFEKYGHKMKTVDINSAVDAFKYSGLEEVPFDLNFERMDNNFHYIGELFSGSRIKRIPKMPNFRVSTSYVYEIIRGAQFVREAPEDLGEEFDWRYFDNETSRTIKSLYSGCYSMRKPNLKIFKRDFSTNLCYGSCFSRCSSLDELVGLPIPLKSDIYEVTANKLGSMVSLCLRLKRLTFEMNNGVPYKVKWKNQLLDLTDNVGYASYSSYIPNIVSYNSGITLDKKVTDDTTYAELKNDPDWFTDKMAYSRYNHTSAVETINSLPDTSEYLATSGGTNTIKFRGACGSSTDGGAISNLTEAEIAVATAKGWTVTLI